MRRLGQDKKGRLQRHQLLTRDGEKGRHKGVAAGDRQGRDVNLRNRRDVEETLRLRDGELGAAWQEVNAREIGGIDPIGRPPF